jgi:Plasmid encoded RepA protein
LATNGPHLRHLKDQLARLAAAQGRMGMVENGHAVQVNTQIVGAFDLWFPEDAEQRTLWPSTVKLSTDYFNSLKKHAVPLDRRAVGAIAGSSLALDLYVWLAQRIHRIPPGRSQLVPWTSLQEQFGPGYARIRDFRRGFLDTLKQVHAVYPTARLWADERGLTLEDSPPPVTSRNQELLLS